MLLTKFDEYVISGMALQWFHDYGLTELNMSHTLIMSTKENITCGIPQGSKLGPLLFLLHMTCQSDQIHVERTRTLYADKRVRIYLPNLVNSIPIPLLQTIATHSLQGFSSNIPYYFIHEYSDICSIANCYICRRRWHAHNARTFLSYGNIVECMPL